MYNYFLEFKEVGTMAINVDSGGSVYTPKDDNPKPEAKPNTVPEIFKGAGTSSVSETSDKEINADKGDSDSTAKGIFVETLMLPENKAPRPPSPVKDIFFGLNNNNKLEKISVARAAPDIKNLVLQGGGAKGTVYPSFLKTLDEGTDLLNSLDEVSGSSAGACMAFLIAAGVPLDQAEEFLKNSSLAEELKGDRRKEATQDVRVSKFGLWSAHQLRETLVKITKEPAANYYKENVKDNQEILKDIAAKDGGKKFIERAENGFNKGMTFSDLKILHELAPKQFKLLSVTAHDKNRNELVYYDTRSEESKDVNCFEAVVASMSLPFLLKSPKIGDRVLQDGGTKQNIPVREHYKPTETLVLFFDNKGKAHKKLHDPEKNLEELSRKDRLLKETSKKVTDFCYKTIIKTEVSSRSALDKKTVRDHAYNSLVVPHGKISTSDFDLKMDKRADAINKTVESAKKYLELRKDHLVLEEHICNDVQSAIKSLKPEEIEVLRDFAPKKIELANKEISEARDVLAKANPNPSKFSKEEELNIRLARAKIARAEYEIEFYLKVKKIQVKTETI